MSHFDITQKPYVRCIGSNEYNSNKNKLNNNESFNIANNQNNPLTKIDGLFCLVKNNIFVYICKVNAFHDDNASIELHSLKKINWEQWIRFGGQRKVTKPGKLQNYKDFVEEIHRILSDNVEVPEVTITEVPEVTITEVPEVTITEVPIVEVNKQLFEEMKEELVKVNKNIETLTNKINKFTSTIQEEPNYPIVNIVMLFMPLIITGIYNYNIT
jgi:hypothetical protein